MNWFKIAKYLLIAEVALATFIVLYILKVALAQSIGIGVMPAILKYNFPSVYEHEFCFFNKGDTDAIYSIQSGDIKVLTEINFTVPANTDINNCVKKKIKFVADKTGYFYVSAFPEEMSGGTVSLVRRIGVKIEVLSSTTTTVQQSGGSGSGGVSESTTTTIFINNTSNATTTIISNYSDTSYQNYTTTTKIFESSNTSSQISSSEESPLYGFLFVAVFLLVAVLVWYFLIK